MTTAERVARAIYDESSNAESLKFDQLPEANRADWFRIAYAAIDAAAPETPEMIEFIGSTVREQFTGEGSEAVSEKVIGECIDRFSDRTTYEYRLMVKLRAGGLQYSQLTADLQSVSFDAAHQPAVSGLDTHIPNVIEAYGRWHQAARSLADLEEAFQSALDNVAATARI